MAMQKKNIIQEFMADSDFLPSETQFIVRYVSGKGNNLHEVECPSLDPTSPSTLFLVSMPKKFRQLVWLRRGDCLVIDPIAEGKKVLGEIICVLPLKSVLSLVENGLWPPECPNVTNNKIDPSAIVTTPDIIKTHFLKFFSNGKTKDDKSASASVTSDSESESETEESCDSSSEGEAILESDADSEVNVEPIPVTSST